MNTEFTLSGSANGVEFTTVLDNGKYVTSFSGQGLQGSFNFSDDEDTASSPNPMELLRAKLFANDMPDQSNYDAQKVFSTPTYFV